MCLAFGVASLDEVGAKLADVLEMQPPVGPRRQAARAQAAEVDRRLAAEQRPQGRLPGDRPPRRRRSISALLPVQTCWPLDAAPFITLPAVITRDPRDRPAERRHVPDAGARPRDRPRCTGSCTRTAAPTSPPRGGRMEVAVALGLDPVTAYSASAPLPKHIDELMFAGFLRGAAVDVVKGVTVDLEVPASAEIVLEGYVEQGDLDRRGALRRPHRLLHAGRAVPGLPPDRDDDAARRDLPVDRRRQAAAGGRLAREGDRADLPAGDPRLGARDRRLRPARRGRVPQLRDRLDPQDLPGAGARR